MPLDLDACRRAIEATVPAVGGRVLRIIGPTVEAVLIGARTGAIFRIAGHQQASVLAEVIGFRDRDAILAPFGDVRGLSVGDPVLPVALSDEQQVGDAYIGRVVDALGHPLDDKPAPKGDAVAPLYRPPPNPLTKKPIDAPLWTDISIIDTMTTVGWGQRLGIFAGPGVGKSTLLGMLARFCNADINVVALIGERGRE
ncbi:MAG: EscN/YscN/HrcN family type III secretion system ATPase, partial [Myxococcota bacterium]